MRMIKRRKQFDSPGFTLIEVLVAMLITSFGLLGIAGLMVSSLRYNQTAWQRSLATELASDMMDRMRANSFALIDSTGAKVSPGPYMLTTSTMPSSTPSAVCTNPSVQCTPAQMAAWDWYEWGNNVKNQLPSGQAKVAWDTTSGAQRILVIVTWSETGTQDASWSSSMESTTNFNTCGNTSGLTTSSSTRCFQVTFYP